MYYKLILPTSLFSLFFLLYPIFHEGHTVYLRTTMACEVEDYAVLFSMKRASLAQSLSFIYTYTGAHNPYPHSCTGYTERNYMYLGVGIMICISG